MAQTWNLVMLRLHQRINILELQNAELRGMLSDAIGLCDAALAQDDARKRLEVLAKRVPPTSQR